MKKSIFFILLVIVSLLGNMGTAKALTVSFPDFSDLSPFTLNGATAAINSGGPINFNGQDVLRLTDNLSQGGSAFLTSPITLSSDLSFSTAFQFQISDPQGASDVDGQGADGIVFVVQTAANNVGGIGGGIGYQGITPSIGIEFDTWLNTSVLDISGNHVGVDLNGSLVSLTDVDISTRMNNSAVWSAWIDYNGLTDLLEVRLAETLDRPSLPLLTWPVDLPSVLGVPQAFVGFTSGTGAAGGDHDIRSWEFRDDFDPIDGAVPEPATLMLIGGGLGGLFAFRKKCKK